METYSLSLGSNSVVSPNVALQAVLLSSGDTVGSTGVRFTLQKGKLFVSCALIAGSVLLLTIIMFYS